jgi:hypothetical protein
MGCGHMDFWECGIYEQASLVRWGLFAADVLLVLAALWIILGVSIWVKNRFWPKSQPNQCCTEDLDDAGEQDRDSR